MAHLGADVAGFVDGQLSESATRDAMSHLQGCDSCASAVRQQRLLKSRMSTVASPEPPQALLASLSGLATAPPPRDRRWERIRHSAPFRACVVLVSASAAMVGTAYAVGGLEQRMGDEVAPPFHRYLADFSGPATVQAGNILSRTSMEELDDSGWPCHVTLAGDLHRTSGSLADHREIVALSYTNGTVRLNLFEQNGSLDPDSIKGFAPTRISGSDVFVRDGVPMLVTWDDDGVVYTIVTDADVERVARAIAKLPSGTYDQSTTERIRGGLDRMTTWVGVA